ncbi:PEGA domain-containing protein [bacterium]|nr:PEGA domain-containing protein [bacterium]
MDFAGGSVTLRPRGGEHKVRVFAGGQSWEKTLKLEAKQTYRETVQPTSGGQQLEQVQNGNLYVETTPPGAKVYLNEVEQSGLTPLSLNELRPGTYTIEVVKYLYQSHVRTVEVRELDYTNVQVDMIENWGSLRIASEPLGALVYINGQQRGLTPLEYPRFNAGTYSVRLVQQLYHETMDTLELPVGGRIDTTYALRPNFGTLAITSDPIDAQVEVDGIAWGTTPVQKDQVLSGTHLVRVHKENFFEQERQVTVQDDETTTAHFDLQTSVGYVSIESDPSEALVTLKESGDTLGLTPLQDIPLEPGTYTVLVEKEFYSIEERVLPVALADRQTVSIPLTRAMGNIRVTSDPSGATVFLDGVPSGETPAVLKDVEAGLHTIRLEKAELDVLEGEVKVTRNAGADFHATMSNERLKAWRGKKTRAKLFALAPGGGQFASPGQWWRGVLYVGGIGAAAYRAMDANDSYDQANEQYLHAMSNYRASIRQQDMDRHIATAEQAITEMENAEQELNLFLFAAGGLYVWQMVDAWIWGGGPGPVARAGDGSSAKLSVRPAASVEQDGVRIGLALRF